MTFFFLYKQCQYTVLRSKVYIHCKEHDSLEIQQFLQLLFVCDEWNTYYTHKKKKKKKEKKEHSWIFGWNHPQASGSPLAEFLTIQNWWNQTTIVALLARTSSAQSRCSCWGSNHDFVRPFQNLKPVLAWFNHSFTTFEVCLGLLSCWNTQLYPRPNLLADSFRFS